MQLKHGHFWLKDDFFHDLNWSISTFDSISLDLGLSDCIDAVSVGFGKASVRCSSPCSQQEQSVSTLLRQCTAASPGISDHPGHPQPLGTSMFLTKPVWLCPLCLVPNPPWPSAGQSRAALCAVNPHPLGLRRSPG